MFQMLPVVAPGNDTSFTLEMKQRHSSPSPSRTRLLDPTFFPSRSSTSVMRPAASHHHFCGASFTASSVSAAGPRLIQFCLSQVSPSWNSVATAAFPPLPAQKRSGSAQRRRPQLGTFFRRHRPAGRKIVGSSAEERRMGAERSGAPLVSGVCQPVDAETIRSAPRAKFATINLC